MNKDFIIKNLDGFGEEVIHIPTGKKWLVTLFFGFNREGYEGCLFPMKGKEAIPFIKNIMKKDKNKLIKN